MKKKVLITGATGNVGKAVLENMPVNHDLQIFKASRKAGDLSEDEVFFDFEDPKSYSHSLPGTDILFLLRPPHLADANKYFAPLIDACKISGVKHIIFLSVQGAEKVKFIPHAKIEALILNSGISYTFIRPSYFMQNLSTTLKDDILRQKRIFLPAGKAPFLWVDVEDIGRAIAAMIASPERHKNKAYTITGKELLNFHEVAQILTEELGQKISYTGPNLLQFILEKRKQGLPFGYILVMIMLHYLPRFQAPPHISTHLEMLTGREPNSLRNFIRNNKNILS